MVTSEAPMATSEAPMVTSEALVATSEAPMATSEAPMATSEAPAATSEAPMATSEAPMATSEAPMVTSEAPAATSEAPVASAEVIEEVDNDGNKVVTTTTTEVKEDGTTVVNKVVEKTYADNTVDVKVINTVTDANGNSSVQIKDTKKDAAGKISAEFSYDGKVLPENAAWNVKSEVSDSDNVKNIREKTGNANVFAWNITPMSDGNAVEIASGSKVRVSLALPDGFEYSEGKNYAIYDVANNVYINVEIKDGMLSFDAEHFSEYALVERTEISTAIETVSPAPTATSAATTAPAATQTATTSKSPTTGDSSSSLLMVLAMVSSCAAIAVSVRKRKVTQ